MSRPNERARIDDRIDPKSRGIHPDAIRVGVAPTSRATCVDCGKKIIENTARSGIKYAGNPIDGVIPLYGSHPMVMWCHPGCGLAFSRLQDLKSEAARTCHLCQDTPDDKQQLRLRCGGGMKGKKILHHSFHIACVSKIIVQAENLSKEQKQEILVKVESIGNKHGLSWRDLTEDEKEFCRNEWTHIE